MKPAIFKPVIMGWKDRSYTLEPNKVMGAIAIVEEHITLHEMQQYAARGTAPLAKLSMAYAAVLNYIGAKDVSADEVYASIVSADDAGIPIAIAGLLKLMVPPASVTSSNQASTPKGNQSTTVAKSSKQRSKRRSVTIDG